MKKIYLLLILFVTLGFSVWSQVSTFNENFASVPTMLSSGGWTQMNLSNPLGTEIWHDGIALSFPNDNGVTSDSNYAEVSFQSTDVSGSGDISNWLISPPMTLHNGDVITFFTTSYNNAVYPDRLELRINPLNNTNVGSSTTSVGDFTILATTVNPNLLADTTFYPENYWGQITATVSGLSGTTTCRIAFRYWVVDGGGTGLNSSTIGVDSLNVTTLMDINTIIGKFFLDANSNGVQDTTEGSLSNKMATEAITSRFVFSDQNGFYSISALDTGNFMISPPYINYYAPVPSSHTVYFSGLNLTDSMNDFAFQPLGVFNDLCISLSPIGRFRAGRPAYYMLNFENVGTTTLNGTVIFIPDSNITFVSSGTTPASITTDSIVWNAGTLAPFQSGSILVTVQIDPSTPIGTPILSNARIEPIAGDANTYCNYAAWQVLSTGSFDPNEILVNRNNILTTDLANPPFLEYIINFQNTGNDTAIDVRILNPIDTNMLQINTIESVVSSHPVNLKYKPLEKTLEFTFSNIFLPDSNLNEPASHGFVRYRIKPKSTLLAGDTIANTAYIYFDFNQPVQTNTAITQIVLPTSLEEFSGDKLRLSVFPNPLTTQTTISFDNPQHETFLVSLSDITGRIIESVTITSGKIILEKGNKPAGVYLITLNRKKTGERVNAKIIIGD